jgi:RHS repeat-associated protein
LEVVDDATYSTATLSEDLTFDSRGRVSGLTNNLGAFGYGYVGQSSRTSTVNYPNGMKTTYGYFGTSTDFLLKQIKNLSSGGVPSVISQFDYTYNPDRTIATWTQKQGSAAATTWTFGYDALQQLTSAVRRDGSNNILENERYGFDAAGNRTEVQTGTTTRDYAVNKLNQLRSQRGFGPTTFAGTLDEAATVTLNGQSVPVTSNDGGVPYRFEGKVNLPAGSNTVTVQAVDGRGNTRTNHYGVTTTGTTALYEYDGDGNLRYEKTAAGVVTREYRWDAQDRLVRIVQGTHESVFDYDGESRRVRIRELDNSVETSNKVYIWCGSKICQRRASNGSTVERVYVTGGFKDSGTSYFTTTDHIGSIRDVMASNGTTISSAMEYSPWGTRKQVGGTGVTSEFGFTGYLQHVPSSSALAPLRQYLPLVARWSSMDPAGGINGPNLSAYVRNRPTVFVDPLGLAIWIEGSAFGEVPLHQSISIGDPNGEYVSYSFGINDHLGSPYIDKKPGGDIERYLNTTPEQDIEALAILGGHFLDDMKRLYPFENCRTYSNRYFEDFKRRFNLPESPAPYRPPPGPHPHPGPLEPGRRW